MTTKAKSPTVAVIMDRNFGSRLKDLPPEKPFWVIDSKLNRAAIQELWKKIPRAAPPDAYTIFNDAPKLNDADIFVSMLDTIDLHHGEYAKESPAYSLEVIGVSFDEKMKPRLDELGLEIIQPTPEGFRAKRRPFKKIV